MATNLDLLPRTWTWSAQIGFAKSSPIKTYIYRQRVFGRVAWVIDPKSE